jgi:hypothetical protein
MTFLLLADQLKVEVNTHVFVNYYACGVKTCYNEFFSVGGSLVDNGNERTRVQH